MMRDAIIKLDNVWKIYKMGDVEVPALKGINLEVRERGFLAVMGPSGSGKSGPWRCLFGLSRFCVTPLHVLVFGTLAR